MAWPEEMRPTPMESTLVKADIQTSGGNLAILMEEDRTGAAAGILNPCQWNQVTSSDTGLLYYGIRYPRRYAKINAGTGYGVHVRLSDCHFRKCQSD